MFFSSFFPDRRALRRAALQRSQRGFRPGTRSNQVSHLLLYLAFTIHFNFPDLPAAVPTLLAFAEFLLRSYSCPKSVTNALSSLRTFHLDHGFQVDAFDHRRLWLFKRALPLTVRHLPSPAPGLPLAVLELLCDLALKQGPKGQVFATFASLLFFSLARASTLLPPSLGHFDTSRLPTLSDVAGRGQDFLLFLKWGKNCQSTSQAFRVPLLRLSGSCCCPVSLLTTHLAALRPLPPWAPLFSLPPSPGSRRRPEHLTLPVARAWLHTLLTLLGLGDRGFTLHSFRRGATTLAFERGAQLGDLKALGGWRSAAVTSYFPALQARLRAARTLQHPTL